MTKEEALARMRVFIAAELARVQEAVITEAESRFVKCGETTCNEWFERPRERGRSKRRFCSHRCQKRIYMECYRRKGRPAATPEAEGSHES